MKYWITIVDDEILTLKSARIILEKENMRVSCLSSGAQLLKFIKKNTPDLILLDIVMPEMDGFDTYEALREYETLMGQSPIPVFFLTGENDDYLERKGLKLGASDYIRKPFDKDILLPRIQNIVKSNKTIENLTEEAMFDKLTGFLNKFRGTQKVSNLCENKSGALMIMDLDSFKLVNDLHGHEAGDDILMAFADIIRRNSRSTDTICRIGGDEFLAFYAGFSDESAIATLSLRINSQLREDAAVILGEEHGIPLGISIGVVMVPEYGTNYKSLFSLADKALYSVKQNGKHGYCVYTDNIDSDTTEIIDPAQRLERVLKIVGERNLTGNALLLGSNSFALVYQFAMRFYKRYGGTAVLILFIIRPKNASPINLMETCASFSNILQQTLRMSDIIMPNGSDSFLVMLTERTKIEVDGALNRVMNTWDATDYASLTTIKYAFKYIEE